MTQDPEDGGLSSTVSEVSLQIEVALRAWFQEALALLSQTKAPLKPKRWLFQDTYGRTGVRTKGYEPYIWSWLEQTSVLLSQLPSTRIVRDILKSFASDDFIAYEQNRWRDADIETPSYIFQQFLRPLLAEHLYESEMSVPSETEITKMVDFIRDYLETPLSLSTPSIAVLQNVTVDEPIELQPGIFIRNSTDLELRRLFFEDSPLEPISSFYAGTHGATGGTPGRVPWVLLLISEEHFPHAREIAESFVFACRLFGLESVGYSHIRQEPANPIRPHTKQQVRAEHGYAHGSEVTSLSGEPGQLAVSHWRKCREVREDSVFQLPIRRFGEAFCRGSFDDQIVDLWIALEALFSERTTGTSEITYKLCMRVSRLLERTPERRQHLYSRLAKSYGLRSKVVHGTVDRKPKEWELLIQECHQLRKDLASLLRLAVVEGWRPNYPYQDFV